MREKFIKPILYLMQNIPLVPRGSFGVKREVMCRQDAYVHQQESTRLFHLCCSSAAAAAAVVPDLWVF